MSSPPWEPQRPPTGPPPGWQQPNPYGPAGGYPHPPPGPGLQWPASGQSPPYGWPPAAPYGGFGAPPPPQTHRSNARWIIWTLVAAVAAIALFSGLYNALGPRDEASYQAGREAGAEGDVFVKYGGAKPEEHCDGQFTLRNTIGGKKTDFRRRDWIAGCLDALEEQLHKP